MAKIEFPIKIDGFKCVEDIAQTVLNYTYKGKTLKEWVDSISEPQTNGDRIRTMTDEELADWLGVYCNGQTAQEVGKPCVSDMGSCEECWLDWLKQEIER